MFKRPLVQAFGALVIGFLLLGPLGSILGFAAWAVIYTKNH